MAVWLRALFRLVCGQFAEHTWAPGGVPLPVCERCTGMYIGAALALALLLALRIRPNRRFLQAHSAFLIGMAPLGYHWIAQQDAVIRTLSGLLFGAALVTFLWLIPGPRLIGLREPGRRAWLLYAGGLASALLSVPAMAAWGGEAGWYALTAMSLAGLATLAALAGAVICCAAIAPAKYALTCRLFRLFRIVRL